MRVKTSGLIRALESLDFNCVTLSWLPLERSGDAEAVRAATFKCDFKGFPPASIYRIKPTLHNNATVHKSFSFENSKKKLGVFLTVGLMTER